MTKPGTINKLQIKRVKRPVSGVLLLDKPIGLSSNGVLQKVKWLFQAEKAGHTGNLDPLATGLLPICLGEATKFSQTLLDADKGYIATVQLGATTTTGDSEGEITETCPVDVTQLRLEALLPQLLGPMLQVPPMYSALKHQGKALYEYARQGVEIERQARSITIFSLTLLDFRGDVFDIAVDCSKGTYIRVLAEEIGRRLGCGAHLSALRRTRTAGFTLQGAVTIEQLEAMSLAERDALLRAADCLLDNLPQVQLDESATQYWQNGNPVQQPNLPTIGELRVYDAASRFIGLGFIQADGRLAPKRVVKPHVG